MTYPHPDVRSELGRWIQRRVDVVAERELAEALEVSVIPTAVLIGPDGRVLDRVEGFLEPEAFLERLAGARRASDSE